MIAYQGRQCAGCHGCATRETIDEFGEQLSLCDRCPSPEEIRRRTAELRANWDELDYFCRRYGYSREMAAKCQDVRMDEVAVVSHGLPLRRAKSMMAIEP
jgi:hypothetical protein